MKRLSMIVGAVVTALGSAGFVLLGTTDLTDVAADSAPTGPTTAICELSRVGFTTCQRAVTKTDTQRLEVTAPRDGPSVLVRASAVDRSPASSRRLEPGRTRILVNAGNPGSYDIQARTSLVEFTDPVVELDVQVVDQ
ncbi:MAG: hypothetical protein JJT89_04240 [Nitriliruptoraceae bacterium]|nr:hypothetical protein [Nitriliruptoraceae bacterium]